MSEIRVATRYAKSIFDLAIEKKVLEKVVDDAKAFIDISDKNHAFENMLKSPIVTSDKKWTIIERIFPKMNPMTLTFIKIVIRKNREAVLKKIFQQVVEMYKEKEGILSATVYTATPISERIKKDITAFLHKETNSEIDLKTKVDENMIGGFLLQYEDKLIDASVASQLKSLRNKLINNN